MAPSGQTGYQVVVAAAASLVVSYVAVFLRFVSRRLRNAPTLTDDYLVVSALILLTSIGTISFFLIGAGFGIRLEAMTHDKALTIRQISYAVPFLYAPTVTCAKLSILFLYRRILPVKYILLTTAMTSGVLVAWCAAIICLDLVHCQPIAKAWDPSSTGTCVDSMSYTFALQIPSIVIDMAIIVIPLIVVWTCTLELPQKAVASGIFMVGIITLAGDIVKFVVMLTTPASSEVTYNNVDNLMWTNIQPALAILAACLPVMKPLVQSPQRLHQKTNKSNIRVIRRMDLEGGGAASPTAMLPEKNHQISHTTSQDTDMLPRIPPKTYWSKSPPSAPPKFPPPKVHVQYSIPLTTRQQQPEQRNHSYPSSHNGSFPE